MSRSYPVIVVPQPEGGFFVECPMLPGCYTQGETVQEALANIQEAILMVLDDLKEHGEPVPDISPPLLTQVSVDA